MDAIVVNRRARLQRELDSINDVLKSPLRAFHMEVEQVGQMLTRKAAIELMLGQVERQVSCEEEMDRQRQERERLLQEADQEEARQLAALRAAMESDPGLRREVEERNRRDGRACAFFPSPAWGPLPGGFPDRLRRKIMYGGRA